jgi:hypothetical protein
MSSKERLQQRIDYYRAHKTDTCQAIEDLADLGKLGQGFTSADPLEEVDISDGTVPTLQGFPPIATNPLGNTTISVAIGGYYCTETVIWLQFVCLLQHKI